MKQILSHTGLRGIAALLVVFYHLQFVPNHLAIEDATSFLKRGYLMVDLFFVLSGFIISYVYTPSEPSGLDPRDFILRRLVRLYPLHLFCLSYLVVASTLLWAVGQHFGKHVVNPWAGDGVFQFVVQLFLVNAYTPVANGWNIPSWSISAELGAYATFPAVIALLLRWPRRASLACLLFAGTFYAIVGSTTGSLDISVWPAPFRCLSGFLLGMLIYQWRHLFDGMSPRAISAAQVMVVVGIILALAVRINDVLAVPLFVALTALTARDRGWLARVLARPVPQYLGEISYSVYLNHVCVLGIVYPVWTALAKRAHLAPALDRSALLGLAVVLVVGVSHLTYHYVEVPSRRQLGRWLNAKRKSASLATS